MAELKATNLLIAILIVTLFVGVLVGVLAKSTQEYGTSFDNESFAIYDNLEEVNNITEEIQNNTENIGTETGVTDILGGFFNDAYQSLKLVKASTGTLSSMTSGSAEELNLGSNTGLFKAVFIAIIIVIIVLGIILAAVVKRSL